MVGVVDISSPGWEGVEATPEATPQYSATDQAKDDKLVARVFATEDGCLLMEWLENAYLSQPTWAPGFATDYGFFREGQNTLIRELKARIDRAKEN